MMITYQRAKEINDYAIQNGVDAAVKHFDFTSAETVNRYMRLYRSNAVGEERLPSQPRVLFFDLETAPNVADVWGMWKQNISPSQLNSIGYMLCYSAKWLGDANILHDCVTPEESIECNDKRITSSLWALLDEADIIIAHNGKSFDRKMANTRFLLNGIIPPSPYKVIDTLLTLKATFRLPYNRLDYVNKVLGLTRKIDTGGHELWTRCKHGDQEALNTMQTYCDGDIVSLEDTYMVLLPWLTASVNFGLYYSDDKSRCHKCGSSDISLTDKYYYTSVSKFPVYKCKCGAYSRSRFNSLTLEKRKSLLSPVLL